MPTRRLVLRSLVLVVGVFVLAATSAPRPAMLEARGPAGAGTTDSDGHARIVVTANGPALGSADGSTLKVTATAPAPDAEPVADVVPPADPTPAPEPPTPFEGTLKLAGHAEPFPFRGMGRTLEAQISGLKDHCGEIDDDDEGPGCLLVFEVELSLEATLSAEVVLTSRSSPGFILSGNGSFPEEARVSVAVQ